MKFTFPPESKPLDGYTIKRAIHRGGFGEVYYALSDAGKEVALKLLQQNMEIELRGVRQCLNLKHPNLVTIFDIRTDADGDHWIVMEFVSGKSLDRVVSEHPDGMPINAICEWLSGIVAGLTYLHDRGIVHRDLKPANVYREHDQVKIGDVGLSKFISESRRGAQTQSVGTVYYMAPEVAHGNYGREVDIYALGVMLYEMLTGRVPFEGESAGEVLMKHLSEKPDLTPLPQRLRPVLARALEKDPLRRTPDAAGLQDEFKQALSGLNKPEQRSNESFVVRSANASAPRSDVINAQTATAYEPRHSANRSHSSSRRDRRTGQTGAGHSTPHRAWHEDRGHWMRVAAIVIVVLALVSPSTLSGAVRPLFLIGIYGLLVYGVFRLVQFFGKSADQIFTRDDPPSNPKIHTQVLDAMPVAEPQRDRRPNWHPQKTYRTAALTPDTRRQIPMRNRVTELTSSLTFAVLSTAIITTGLALLEFLPDPSSIGFFGITTLLASWAVLVPSKLWEGTGADAMHRRMTSLVLGAAVGSAAFWLGETLLVEFPFAGSPSGLIAHVGTHDLVSPSDQPTLAAYILFFAGLFSLRRWWWHTDSFRPKQYRVASALLTLLLGYLLTVLFTFPHMWGMIWAVAISSVVQLSAVWVPPEHRPQVMETKSHV